MSNTTVLKAHRSNYPDPVVFENGDRLKLGDRDTEYPGWVRATDTHGVTGWAPLGYMKLIEEGAEAVAVQGYSARELDVDPGERLCVEYEHCQWCWVSHATKGAGWVPKACLELP